MPAICLLFFVSGCPALIYQIVWQRALFAIYGVNVESVTIVVTVFMLGLGLGSLAGGRLSQIDRLPALPVFGCIELSIGAFGVISLRLFHWAGTYTAGAPLGWVAVLTFLLILAPTLLMGGTLPFLVAHFVRVSKNVGASVGALYYVNTLGSAFACVMCARFLMRVMGESGSVGVAAALNGAVGLTALMLSTRARGRIPGADIQSLEGKTAQHPACGKPLPFSMALALVGFSGFISLSYEILWYRAYSFATGTRASAFALLLAAYLEGIAFGALWSKAICGRRHVLRIMALLVAGGSILGFLAVPLIARMVQHVTYVATLPLVALSAGLLGAVFPVTTHLSVPPDGLAGTRTSRLYLSNIIGSAAGTALTGFVLMDYLSLQQISMALLVLGLALGTVVYAGAIRDRLRRLGVAAAALVLSAVAMVSAGPLFDTVYERMMFKRDYQPGYRFAHLVESRSGIIAVGPDGTVFGGGVYDGRFHTSLVDDTNMLVRAYAISAFHPSPREVLMIGLSSGSWAQVIASNPAVGHLTVIEINPDYLELIPQYPEVASLLHNPKITIEIDDGRRWLFRHRERRFDLIVSNTTFNWREHTTNLLSSEFLQVIRRHLRPGGVFYYNTTDSGDALLTGATEFPYALRILNFLAVSDRPLRFDKEAWRRTLLDYRIDGTPVFDLARERDLRRLGEILGMADSPSTSLVADSGLMEYAATIRMRFRRKRIITDDNMGTEWSLN